MEKQAVTQTQTQQVQTIQKDPNWVQSEFLNRLRKSGINVLVYMINGTKLQGKIVAYDSFSILIENSEGQTLLFKHSISSIVPLTDKTGR